MINILIENLVAPSTSEDILLIVHLLIRLVRITALDHVILVKVNFVLVVVIVALCMLTLDLLENIPLHFLLIILNESINIPS